MPEVFKERREHLRHDVEIPVTLRTRGKLIPAAALDLSLGGIAILTDYNEEISEGIVEVIMDLSPKLKDVSLRGRVLRHKRGIGQKVAIQFTTFNSQGHQTLTKFLQKRFTN